MADFKFREWRSPIQYVSGVVFSSSQLQWVSAYMPTEWYKKDWDPKDLFKDFKDYTPPGGQFDGGGGGGSGKLPIDKENLISREDDWQEMKWGDKPGTKLSGFYLGICRQNNYYCGVVQDEEGNVQMFSMPTQLHNQIARLTRHRHVSIEFTGTKRTERGRMMKEFKVEVTKEATQTAAEKELAGFKKKVKTKLTLEQDPNYTSIDRQRVVQFPDIIIGHYEKNTYYVYDNNKNYPYGRYLYKDKTWNSGCDYPRGAWDSREAALEVLEELLCQ